MTTELRRPTLDLFDSWAAAVSEFDGAHVDGAGLARGAQPDLETCRALIAKARIQADTSAPIPDGLVHCDLYWITDDGEVVGFIALRHALTDYLAAVGGHIGYSVRPSRRRQGHASRALALGLSRARAVGLERVLVTCDDHNVASYRTIEGAGGVLADVIDRPEYQRGLVRRYWIPLTPGDPVG